MTTLHFELTRDLILTANQRLHWAPKARKTSDLRQLGYIEGRRVRRATFPSGMAYAMWRAHLIVRVGWPQHRRRDVANLSPTIKALIDGCVDAGLLPDDDDAHLIGPDLRPYHAGRKGLVVLDFEFTPADEREPA